MPYNIKPDQNFEEEFEKLKKKNKVLHEVALKKIMRLSEEPHIGKPLRNILKGKWRVHLGHFQPFADFIGLKSFEPSEMILYFFTKLTRMQSR